MVTEIYTKILKKGANMLFQVELLKDQSVIAFRMDMCNRCPNFNAEYETCGICGCFMDVKTTHLLTRNVKRGRIETTHCPIGRWNDKHVANHYREMDGKVALD